MINNSDRTWNLFSKYRSELMCVSIIGILFCHLLTNEAVHGIEHSVLSQLLMYGACFVDAFMFLSGIGLYYSFQKKNGDIKTFYKKRFVRVLPSYIIIALPILIICAFLYDGTVSDILFQFSFISFFLSGETFAWFILAICILYLLFPLIYKFIYQGDSPLLHTVILCGVLFGIALVLKMATPEFYYNIDIALDRFPAFVVGVYCGKLCKNGKEIGTINSVLVVALALLVFAMRVMGLVPGFLVYFSCSIIGIGIIFAIAFIFEGLTLYLPQIENKFLSVLRAGGGVYA